MVIFNAPGHIVFGFGAAFVAHTFGVPMGLFGFGCVLVGSLLPDIDHPKSTLGRYNLINRTKFCKHRGKCHSLLGAFLLSTPFILFGGYRGLVYVFCGAVGHLVADKLYSMFPRKKAFSIKLW